MDELDYQLYQKWLSALLNTDNVGLDETKLAFAHKDYAEKMMLIYDGHRVILTPEEVEQVLERDASNVLRHFNGPPYTGRLVKNGVIETYVDGFPVTNGSIPFYIDLEKGTFGGRGFNNVSNNYVHEFNFTNGGASLIDIEPNVYMLSSKPSHIMYNPSQYLRSIPEMVDKNRRSWTNIPMVSEDMALEDILDPCVDEAMPTEAPLASLETAVKELEEVISEVSEEAGSDSPKAKKEESLALPMVAGLLGFVAALGAMKSKAKVKQVAAPAQVEVAR